MGSSYKFQKNIMIFSFLLIPITLLLLFLFYPTLKLFQLSITDWDGIGKSFNYIGLSNYKAVLFDSPDVWASLRNNFMYLSIHLLMIPVEIVVAVILCSKIVGASRIKAITFMPYIINGVAVAYMFSFIFSPMGGPLNNFLEMIGLKSLALDWLGDANVVNFSLVSVSLWRFCGLHIVLFIAGVTSIPKEIYEAADIDGAGSLQKLMAITIPGIKRVIEIILFLNVRGALQVFDIPFLMTHGGPGYASSTFTTYTIDTAFKFGSFGFASAMAVVLMVIICLVSYIQNKVIRIRG